jgi:hypothetical protein
MTGLNGPNLATAEPKVNGGARLCEPPQCPVFKALPFISQVFWPAELLPAADPRSANFGRT